LLKLCRKYDPDLGQLVLHHARTGRRTLPKHRLGQAQLQQGLQGVYSSCRSIINLSPASRTTTPAWSCLRQVHDARRSRHRPAPERCTGLFELDQTFDEEAWRLDLEGKHTGVKVSIQDVIDCIADGHRTRQRDRERTGPPESLPTRTVRPGSGGQNRRFCAPETQRKLSADGKSQAAHESGHE
jgi:hypothetical protein